MSNLGLDMSDKNDVGFQLLYFKKKFKKYINNL